MSRKVATTASDPTNTVATPVTRHTKISELDLDECVVSAFAENGVRTIGHLRERTTEQQIRDIIAEATPGRRESAKRFTDLLLTMYRRRSIPPPSHLDEAIIVSSYT